MRIEVDVDAKITLKKALVNVEHIHVCRFRSLKGLLPKSRYNKEHRKCLLKSFGKMMGRCMVKASPKK
jgi:hypothetical protein